MDLSVERLIGDCQPSEDGIEQNCEQNCLEIEREKKERKKGRKKGRKGGHPLGRWMVRYGSGGITARMSEVSIVELS